MKNIHLTHVLIIGLALVSLALISAGSYPVEEKKDVLMLEVNFFGMYVFESDKPAEYTALNPTGQKRNIEGNGQLIQGKLQELYAQGWKLEEACASDIGQRFILVK